MAVSVNTLGIDPERTCDAVCPSCQAKHQVQALFRAPNPGEVRSRLCESCEAAEEKRREDERKEWEKQQEEEQRRERLKELDERWRSGFICFDRGQVPAICPKRFQDFDPERFTGNRDKLNEAVEWQFGPQGLVLHGYTGQGKSWAAFLIAKREHFAGRRVSVVNGSRLRDLVALSASSNTEYNREVHRIIDASLVVLNDPFKAKLTDKVEETLWTIVDERYEAERPIILTMNGVSANVEPLLSPERGKALFRRLREESQIIHFPKPEKDD